MPSCPHVSHEKTQSVSASAGAFSYCRENCSRTFFFCRHCGEANRTLARYCRACGEPVSFDDVNGTSTQSSSYSSKGEGEKYPLTGLDFKEVRALQNYLGHLLVVTDAGVLLLDPHRPQEPLKVLRAPVGSPLRGVAPVSTQEDRELLITSAQQVYRQSLLNSSTSSVPVYQASDSAGSIYGTALGLADDVYLLEYNGQNNTSRLVKAPGQTVVSFKGRAQQPLAVVGGRIFFSTAEKLFLYDAEREVMLDEQNAPERLNTAAAPVYSSYHRQVFLAGDMKLWRVDVEGDTLAPSPLTMTAVGDPRLAAGADKIIMATTNDLFVLNPFGVVKWKASDDFVKAQSDGSAPQIFDDCFIFTGLGRMGGTDVRIHRLHTPKDYETVTYEKPLMCPPIISLGRLFAVARGERSVELIVR